MVPEDWVTKQRTDYGQELHLTDHHSWLNSTYSSCWERHRQANKNLEIFATVAFFLFILLTIFSCSLNIWHCCLMGFTWVILKFQIAQRSVSSFLSLFRLLMISSVTFIDFSTSNIKRWFTWQIKIHFFSTCFYNIQLNPHNFKQSLVKPQLF